MPTSIRRRIGVSVLAVVVGLLTLQTTYLLSRLRSAGLNEADLHLQDEIAELTPLLGTPELQAHIARETSRQNKWSELFVEIRGAGGAMVASSANLPREGFRATRPANLPADESWQVPDPHSRRGHRKILLRERDVAGYRVLVGRSLRLHQKTYYSLREKLAGVSLLIALLGAGCAWFVATRALAPIQSISARARELEGTVQGFLPRTGTGDELDQLAAVLNDLLERIRIETARMQRMTADAGHALRTPLTAMRGNLELRLNGAGAQDVEHLEDLMTQVDRLIRMVNELLSLEKIEVQGLSQPVARLDLAELVEDLLSHLEVLGHERGISLKSSLRAAHVVGSPVQLREAIANLVSNALRHAPDRGSVHVALEGDANRIELRVFDDGPGVPPEDLERVFERFYSTTNSGSGTGLGLAIARAVARAHGGNLVAVPRPGGRFVLELPRA